MQANFPVFKVTHEFYFKNWNFSFFLILNHVVSTPLHLLLNSLSFLKICCVHPSKFLFIIFWNNLCFNYSPPETIKTTFNEKLLASKIPTILLIFNKAIIKRSIKPTSHLHPVLRTFPSPILIPPFPFFSTQFNICCHFPRSENCFLNALIIVIMMFLRSVIFSSAMISPSAFLAITRVKDFCFWVEASCFLPTYC